MKKLLAIVILTILLNVDVYGLDKQRVISANQNSLNNNIEALNQEISSTNQITLIYGFFGLLGGFFLSINNNTSIIIACFIFYFKGKIY